MRARLLEMILWIYCFLLGSKKKTFYEREMKKSLKRGDKEYKPAKWILKRFGMEYRNEQGMGCIYKQSTSPNSRVTMFYLHGGAYSRQPMLVHYNFIAKLQEKSRAEVIAPLYPKAPHHTVDESFERLKNLYMDYCEKNPTRDIVLVGDSSGGGFAVAFAQYIQAHNLKKPKHVIAFCPWLDITMTHPKIQVITRKDPVFSPEGLSFVGKMYAGQRKAKDWMISPIYGTMSGCSPLTLFTGTRDIFYPDILDFYRCEKNHNAAIKLYTYENQVHDFQLFPVRLSKKVIHLASELIKN